MKPKLPIEIELLFPVDIVRMIYSFVPHLPTPSPVLTSLQRELERVQHLNRHGKKETYMRGFEEFVLD